MFGCFWRSWSDLVRHICRGPRCRPFKGSLCRSFKDHFGPSLGHGEGSSRLYQPKSSLIQQLPMAKGLGTPFEGVWIFGFVGCLTVFESLWRCSKVVGGGKGVEKWLHVFVLFVEL